MTGAKADSSLPTDNTPTLTTCVSLPAAAPSQTSSEWGEWTDHTSAYVDDDAEAAFKELMNDLGDQWVDFPQRINVKKRESTVNPDLVQYMLCDIFNHVDIVLDYDRSTMILRGAIQDTGIAISTPFDNGFSTYHFAMNPVMMTEFTMTIFQDVYPGYYRFLLMVDSERGYGINSLLSFSSEYLTILADHTNYTQSFFMPSHQASISIPLAFPEGISSTYRYVCVDYMKYAATGNFGFNFYDLLLPDLDPEVVPYTESSSPMLTITPESVFSLVIVAPLDIHGNPAGISSVDILWNKPQDGDWKPSGTATLKEHLWLNALDFAHTEYPFLTYDSYNPYYWSFTGGPVTQQLEIEVSDSNPAIYRIKNPFGPQHPYYEYFDSKTDPGDDFYLAVDASNPDYVTIIPSCAGYSSFVLMNPANVYYADYTSDPDKQQYYGKLENGKITFGMPSLSLNGIDYPLYLHFYANNPVIEIELPSEAGISSPEAEDAAEAEAVYYNLQGQRVANPSGGVYIRVKATGAEKVTLP